MATEPSQVHSHPICLLNHAYTEEITYSCPCLFQTAIAGENETRCLWASSLRESIFWKIFDTAVTRHGTVGSNPGTPKQHGRVQIDNYTARNNSCPVSPHHHLTAGSTNQRAGDGSRESEFERLKRRQRERSFLIPGLAYVGRREGFPCCLRPALGLSWC